MNDLMEKGLAYWEALARAARVPDFLPILKAMQQDTDRCLRNAQGKGYRRLQGRAQVLEELVTELSGAAEAADRHRRGPGPALRGVE